MLFGWLYDYRSRTPIRPAIASERSRSRAAESDANPLGAFDGGDGVPVYVDDAPED